MEAADLLCDSLFHWLEKRKECADKLLELAQELENVQQGSNIAQVVGAAASVLSISGAAVATFLTGGLAFPLLVATTTGTVAGAAVSVTSGLVEAGVSRSTFKKATELIEEDEEVGTTIQKQLRDLKDRCGGTQLGTDELCEVTTQLMWALAKRNNIHIPIDFLRDFNRAMFFRHITPDGLDPAKASRFIGQALSFVGFTAVITSSLMLSAKVLGKNIGQISIKAVAKAGSEVLGVIGLGVCLYDLIVKSEELVKGNQVTEASKFLRDSARKLLEGQEELKKQLDGMQEIIQKLFRMKNLIKDLGGYSLSLTEDEQNIIDYIMGTCTDNTVLFWLQGVTHQIEFVNLLRLFLLRSSHILEDLDKPGGDHIDIVFVAHGRIVDQFMPAGGLVSEGIFRPIICDTILYSPWNCAINAKAAFGIAQGNIKVEDRKFKSKYGNEIYYKPNPLPNHWNSMRRSRHKIPVILLSPVTPEDEAWSLLQKIWMERGMEIKDRIIIPYLVPNHLVGAFSEIPLYILIFVTSFMLMMFDKTATVHLAACLGRAGSPERPEEWRRQYAYTSDGTWMSMKMDKRNMNSMLYRALRSMFDRNCR